VIIFSQMKRRATSAKALLVGLALSIASALLLAPVSLRAEITRPDMLVAGRAIGFIDKLGSGDVRVGIVFAPESAPSLQQANEIRDLLGSQFRVGNHVLRPVMVRADQVNNAGVDLFLLTEGADIAASSVAASSRARKIPCITFDLAQERNGACVIGVQTRPRIEILFNRKAAAESGTNLSSVFRLMITEN